MADALKSFYEWECTTDGERVYREVVRRCRALKERGIKHFGIAAIWEAIRFDFTVALEGDEEFRLNNNHKPYMARKVMKENKDLDEFFELRMSVADDIFLGPND